VDMHYKDILSSVNSLFLVFLKSLRTSQ